MVLPCYHVHKIVIQQYLFLVLFIKDMFSADYKSDFFCLSSLREEELYSPAQGPTWLEFRSFELPGKWDHPADRAARSRHGSLCQPDAESVAACSSVPYSCHLGSPDPGASTSCCRHHIGRYCTNPPSPSPRHSLPTSGFHSRIEKWAAKPA